MQFQDELGKKFIPEATPHGAHSLELIADGATEMTSVVINRRVRADVDGSFFIQTDP